MTTVGERRTNREGIDRLFESGAMSHEPVLLEEVLQLLAPAPSRRYVDATVGTGGHAKAILERSSPDGRLLGLDLDPSALALAGEELSAFGERVILLRGSFAELPGHLDALGWKSADGILADLGLSSLQLDSPHRGFAFSKEGPLDMRFDPDAGPTAADLLNRLSERELADLLFSYGEERRSRAIARRIVALRPLSTTSDLRRAVHSVLGSRKRGGIDTATRTFQALRIAVNQELAALAALLQSACDRLGPGGRLAIISYHSLEDRQVKGVFRQSSRQGTTAPYRVLTRRPVRPGEEEIRRNRRARSARLRVLERLG